MQISISVGNVLPQKYAEMTLLNLSRLINYYSTAGVVSQSDGKRLLYKKSNLFPEWVSAGEINIGNDTVNVNFTVDEGVPDAYIEALKESMGQELQLYFGYPVEPFKNRIFCIGWPKTGTTSLLSATGFATPSLTFYQNLNFVTTFNQSATS
jgi:hypothetical protein